MIRREPEQRPHAAGSLLKLIYANHGGKFVDSGNRAWVVESGPTHDRTLANLYDEVRERDAAAP